MIIDIFPHIVTPKYKKALLSKLPNTYQETTWYKYLNMLTSLSDLDSRLRIMDKHEGYVQVLNISLPALETLLGVADTIELTRMANDEMAELVAKYPDRFVAAAAVLPLMHMDEALKELDRAINQLKLRGMLIRHPVNGKPLDSPEFWPLYDRMSQYDLPIFLHPVREIDFADYPILGKSKYDIFRTFGLPYETTVTMSHIVFGGVLQKYPDLKFVIRHLVAKL